MIIEHSSSPTEATEQTAQLLTRIFALAGAGELPLETAIFVTHRLAVGNPTLGVALSRRWLNNTNDRITFPVWHNLSLSLQSIGDSEGAMEAERAALANGPGNEFVAFLSGIELQRAGAAQMAIEKWTSILDTALRARQDPRDKKQLILYSLVRSELVQLLESQNHPEIAKQVAEIYSDKNYSGLMDFYHAEDGRIVVDVLSTIGFDIVKGCQLRCIGCANATLLGRVEMIDPEFFRTCLYNIDVKAITYFRLFNFGEALLHKKLVDVVKVLADFRSHGPVPIGFVEISTNAQAGNLIQLEQVLKMGTIDRLVVSCDGDGTKEKYETMRPPSKWEKFLHFLDFVRNVKERDDLPIELITRTIVSCQADEERWNELLLPRGWRPEFRTRINLPGAPVNNRRGLVPSHRGRCELSRERYLYVDGDGTVVTCCAHPRVAEYGNLGKSKFSEIINAPPRKDFVETLERRRHEIALCNECDVVGT
jgi:radical SAM protein with 4Fe4S-binding SPASM domain